MEEPQLTGTDAEEDVGVAKGDWAGKVGAAEVALATGDGRPGNMAIPGVEDLWGAGTAEGVKHLLGAEAAASELGLVREDNEASPLVTAEDKAEEFIKLESFDVKKPFKADRRGLFTASGPATLGAAPPAITGVGLDTPWDVGAKGKGRPANTDDSEAELGLLIEAAVELAEKERLVKEAEVEAKVSLEARVARGVDVA